VTGRVTCLVIHKMPFKCRAVFEAGSTGNKASSAPAIRLWPRFGKNWLLKQKFDEMLLRTFSQLEFSEPYDQALNSLSS
jgi:hypothetical protein